MRLNVAYYSYFTFRHGAQCIVTKHVKILLIRNCLIKTPVAVCHDQRPASTSEFFCLRGDKLKIDKSVWIHMKQFNEASWGRSCEGESVAATVK